MTTQCAVDHAAIAAWLAEHKAFDIQPVTVSIGKQTWIGCRYTQEREYTQDMGAVQWGKRKAGDKYRTTAIYCVGALPKAKAQGRDKHHVCFPFEGKDWYVAAYVPEKAITPAFAEFHPFGANFMLCPWDLPDSKIDDGETRPYVRIPMTVETR